MWEKIERDANFWKLKSRRVHNIHPVISCWQISESEKDLIGNLNENMYIEDLIQSEWMNQKVNKQLYS